MTVPIPLADRPRRVLDQLSCWWTEPRLLELAWLTGPELDSILHGLERAGLIEVHGRDRISWSRSPTRCRVRPTPAGTRPVPDEPQRLPEASP